MFNYYKKIFILTLKSEFAEKMITQQSFKEGNENDLLNLKALKTAITDGKIDGIEAMRIANNINKIESQAKQGLTEIAQDMLSKGFSAKNESVYNAFKKIMESSKITIPEWSVIMSELNSIYSNFQTFDSRSDKFHGIVIKGNKIQIYYDGIGREDTLNINYDNNGIIPSTNNNWTSEGKVEEIDVSEEGIVDSLLLNDNIDTMNNKTKETVTEIQKLNNLAKGDDSLIIEGDKAYFNVKSNDGKPHRAYFTIKEGSSIKDQSSLDIWKTKVTKKLQNKYNLKFTTINSKESFTKYSPEVQAVFDKLNSKPAWGDILPVEDGKRSQKMTYKGVLGHITIKTDNPIKVNSEYKHIKLNIDQVRDYNKIVDQKNVKNKKRKAGKDS